MARPVRPWCSDSRLAVGSPWSGSQGNKIQCSHRNLILPQVSHLACPACLGELRMEEPRLVCAGCGRVYPVVGGIPVLIAERAEKSGSATAVKRR